MTATSATTVLRNGLIVDGSGRPPRIGDVGICGDRISAVGERGEVKADSTVNADGLVICPGFIEVHTHYDPQLCWDGFATPALEHGVTTILTGNCSLSLAPAGAGFAPKITRMFNRIEDLAPEFFERAVPYCWQTFPEYLEWLKPRLELNVGASVGHSNLRHSVMGAWAQERAASREERAQLCAALEAAVAGGAFGLSTTYDHIHDEANAPVASALADLNERTALAKTLSASGRTFYQCNVNPLNPQERIKQFSELAHISRTTGVVCSALGVMENPIFPDHWRHELELLRDLNSDEAKLYAEAQVRPLDMSFTLAGNWIGAFYMENWAPIMVRPPQERMQLFSAAERRPGLLSDIERFRAVASRVTVQAVRHPANQAFLGRTVQQISDALNVSLGEALLRVALKDDLQTVFDWSNVFHADMDAVTEILQHPSILLGGSDAGAHVSQFSGEGDGTYLLARFVREHRKLSLEHAIFLLTGNLASRLGIRERGFLRPGYFADLLLLDPGKVERGVQFLVNDMPGGTARYTRSARGVERVYVNGRCTWNGLEYTSHRAGRLI